MKLVARVFNPTENRRLNELIGFLLFICAILVFLALASYSPLDPSLNTAASAAGPRPTHNWIGLTGAAVADLLLQLNGIAAFLLPLACALLGLRWFRSRKVDSPIAKAVGGLILGSFIPAMLALLPFGWRWLHAVPIEGMLGRIFGDALMRWFNVTGAAIVCAA